MPRFSPRLFLTLLSVVAVGFAGCWKVQNARDRVKASNDLKQLGLAYWNFQDSEGRPPKSFEELNKKEPLPPDCSRATVYWGAGMGPMCKDGASSEIIIGHLPNPGGKGMLALFCDGSVRAIPQEEFDKAKKAKPLAGERGQRENAKW